MKLDVYSMADVENRNYSLGYRADIEGLRAIAILLVVAAHARVPGLAGGFIGVDVFFVLSGFLITGLLVKEVRTTGSLHLWRFYARRLRRLLPALFLMLVCVGLLAWLLLPVFDQSRQADSEASAGAWISNFYFSMMRVGYFDSDASSNLFLHTWSLGVEEQFYLLWPALIFLGYWTWKPARKPVRATRTLWVMSALLAASFLLDFHWSKVSPEFAFYMMPARAWQFAAGALTYMLFAAPDRAPSGNRHGSSRWTLPASAGWVGMALVLIAAAMLNGDMTYPGAWALMPTLGTAAVLANGSRPAANLLARLLSIRPLQAIGRVSYSWYLWHWPVLLLGTEALGYRTPFGRSCLVLLSLAFAAGSYLLVEKPIRRARWMIVRPRLTVSAGVVVAISAFLLANGWSQHAMQEKYSARFARFITAKADTPLIYLMGCDSWYHSAEVKPCTMGPPDAKKTVAVMGDSIAMQWFPAIEKVFKPRHWRIVVLTKSACPMVSETYYYARIKKPFTVCSMWRKKALKQLEAIRPDVVILGSAYDYPFTEHEWIEGTGKFVGSISKVTSKIYLIRATPELPFDGPSCLAPHSALFHWLSRNPDCTTPAESKAFDQVYAWQKDAVDSLPNVTNVDMTSSVCPEKMCSAGRDGMVVYRDNRHITATFARSLTTQLALKLNLPIHGTLRTESVHPTSGNHGG